MDKSKRAVPFTLLFSVYILIAITAIITVVVMGKKTQTVDTTANYMAVYSQMIQVAELTTVKNNYSDVVCVKKIFAGGLSKAYSIVKFSGVIRAGIRDTAAIKCTVSPDGKSVTAAVPHCEVLGNGLVAQEIFDEKKGVFVSVTAQEIFDEISKGMSKSQENAVAGGLLDEADVQVKQVMTALLTACGFSEVTVNRL
jgi:hypothetical protein